MLKEPEKPKAQSYAQDSWGRPASRPRSQVGQAGQVSQVSQGGRAGLAGPAGKSHSGGRQPAVQPCSQAARQPGCQAARQPGCQAARLPDSRKPLSQAASQQSGESANSWSGGGGGGGGWSAGGGGGGGWESSGRAGWPALCLVGPFHTSQCPAIPWRPGLHNAKS